MASNGRLTGLERMMRRAQTANVSRRGILKGTAAAAGAAVVLQGNRYGLPATSSAPRAR